MMTAMKLKRMMRFTRPTYTLDDHSKKRLNGRKNQPNRPSMSLVRMSRLSPWPFSSSAESAGESVSELMAEMTVEMAMVTANCL